MSVLPVEWRGERFILLGDRVLYWAREKALFVADTHFGKEAAFQHYGVPVPGGVLQSDLARLSYALSESGAERLIFLGDFWHAKEGRSREIMEKIEAWVSKQTGIGMTLIRGNHDRHAGDPPAEWGIVCYDEPLVVDGLQCWHQIPIQLNEPEMPSVGGHVHPGVVLYDSDGSRLRLPCFHFDQCRCTLPAFGSFTGMFEIAPAPNDMVYVVNEKMVAKVSLRA